MIELERGKVNGVANGCVIDRYLRFYGLSFRVDLSVDKVVLDVDLGLAFLSHGRQRPGDAGNFAKRKNRIQTR